MNFVFIYAEVKANKMLKKFVCTAMTFLLLFGGISPILPAKASEEVTINAESAILIDANTGKILYEKRADELLPPASMSKMMTEYLVLEAIHKQTISWDQKVPISDFVAEISHESDASNVFLDPEQEYTVKDLYEAMAIESANAATMALAEFVAGGSYERFVEMMNEKAKELGLKDYVFVNSTGLPNNMLKGRHVAGSENDEDRLTARSTAKLAYRLINDYPEVLETSSIPMKRFQGEVLPDADPLECLADWTSMAHWNEMLKGLKHEYEGMLGLKTGYTEAAKYCFTGVAERNGMRLISVVMRSDSQDQRFIDTKRLLDYGFNHFEVKEILPKGAHVEGFESLDVTNGKEKKVPISTTEPLKTIVKKGEEDLYEPVFVLDEEILNEEGELTAPVKKDTIVGHVELKYNGDKEIRYIIDGGKEIVSVSTDAAVEKANWFIRMMRGIGGFFSGVFSSVVETVKGWF